MSNLCHTFLTFLIASSVLVSFVNCRIHHLSLEDDMRNLIPISTFGFYKGGSLEVNVHKLYMRPEKDANGPVVFGFTVDRTATDGMNPYSHNIENTCVFGSSSSSRSYDYTFTSIKLQLDLKANRTVVICSPELTPGVRIYKTKAKLPLSIGTNRRKSGTTQVINAMTQKQKRNGTVTSGLYDYYDESSELYDSESGQGIIGSRDNEAVSPDTLDVADKKLFSNNLNNEGIDGSDAKSNEAQNQPQAAESESSIKSNPNNEAEAQNQPQAAESESSIKSNPNNEAEAPRNSEEDIFKDPGLIPNTGSDAVHVTDSSCNGSVLLLNASRLSDGTLSYSMNFVVFIEQESGEGLYNLYFHSCAESVISRVTLDLSVTEENNDSDGKNYLSAGEMPLPALYFMMSVLFLTAGCFWVVVLKKSRKETGVSVFKIHYLMASLVFVKSLSLFFHSMNYHYIQVYGTHVEGWAVLYYITHLVKGALLFLTILLIGTGYAFVKHLLSDKEKKLFMVVIPLQVLANVAQIIIEESEQGEIVHTTWNFIFISVDLLCCGAILFPVVWSIRHLQEASQTDGKAATNLRKLKLFRHFYIMVVCYIYFTRIIVQLLLRITVPFKYEWLDDMFREMTTFIFFVLTGYKFRPAINNPYLELAHDTDDETDNMDIALTESGLTSGLSKRGFKPKKTLREIVLFDPNEDDTDDDEEVLLEKREASHDFD